MVRRVRSPLSMDDLIRRLLFYDDLSLEERRDARNALADALGDEQGDEKSDKKSGEKNGDALRRALRRWQAARERVGERFRGALPERRLLVLHALADDPDAGSTTLSATEREELAAARPQIDEALRAHPALGDVLDEIRRERDTFQAVWDEHTASAPVEDALVDETTEETPPAHAAQSGDRRARRAADRSSAPRSPKRRTVQRWGWRIASGAALLAFAAVLFFVFQREQSTVTVTAEGDAPRLVHLADGSTVRLTPGSTLSYVDPESIVALDRQATLEAGRAFFDITHDRQGFIVETPTARVTVLGTRFDVRAEERATRVVLASGRVALTSRDASGRPVMLAPGHQSRVAAGARPSTPVAVEDLAEMLAWTGRFYFRDTPAEDLAEQLAEHYDQTVKVAPPLRTKQVTGTFDRDRPLRETLRTVAAALGARLEPIPGGYALVPGAP